MERKRCLMGLGLLMMACSLLLTGCWGKREVEELAPLIGVGFDLGQKPGTYLITEQFAMPKKGSSNSAEIEDWTISVEAESAREGNEMTSKILNREPFMGSLKVIVIGEDAAKAGFNNILDFAQRFSEFRRLMYLVLAKGKAKDILNMKLRNGELPAMYIKENIETSDTLSTFPVVRLGHYFTVLDTESTAEILPVIQIVKSGEEGIEYQAKEGAQEALLQGAGVLRGDRLADYLSDEETKGYMWLENQISQRPINAVDLNNNEIKFTGQVLNSKTKYKIVDQGGTKGLQYQIKANIEVDEVMGLKEKLSDAEWVNLMAEAEMSFAKVIEQECRSSIQKEKALGLDFLGIGRHLEKENSAYWKTIKDHWAEKIAEIPLSVNVQTTINHSGMSNSSATTNNPGEGQD